MYCHNCGTNLDNNSEFCHNCGTKVENPDGQPKSKNKKSLKFTAIVSICLCAVITAAGCGALAYFNNLKYDFNPQNVLGADTDIRNIQDEKIKTFENTSEDWEEGIFVLDGVEYQLPIKISELEKSGWEADRKVPDFLEEDEYFTCSYIKGNHVIYVDIFCLEEDEAEFSDCCVTNITFRWADPILANNIISQISTKEEVLDSFGEPDRDYDIFLQYGKKYDRDYDDDSGVSYILKFNSEKDDGVLMSIRIEYIPEEN